MPKSFIILSISIFLFSCNILAQKPPWVKERPVDNSCFIGIGYAKKTNNKDHITLAKENALSDLASEISVNIENTNIYNILEVNDNLIEKFESNIRSETKARIEGYELFKSWSDQEEYWVYYRLSKKKYYTLKEKRKNEAVSQSKDFFLKAVNCYKKNNISNSIYYNLKALAPLENYIGEGVRINYQGEKIYLLNEICSNLQKELKDIQLQPINREIRGKTIQLQGKKLKLLAFCNKNGKQLKIADLPIQFEYKNGKGEIISNNLTDKEGIATARITQIAHSEKIQYISAKLNLKGFMDLDTLSHIYNLFLNYFPTPSTHFNIKTQKLTVFIESVEKNLNKTPSVQYIEPQVKNILSKKNYNFSDSKNASDYIIKIHGETRKGSEIYDGMYSSFADLNMSILHTESNKEIFKEAINNIKGIHLNYQSAGQKALKKAGEELYNKIKGNEILKDFRSVH
ncbi:MAG: LPP20 family lipoprotein [Candidatus Cloacimonetes bacterium]|nr:LPP20 family lipoprotein [Candidatus Cloacimonadota bacterium]